MTISFIWFCLWFFFFSQGVSHSQLYSLLRLSLNRQLLLNDRITGKTTSNMQLNHCLFEFTNEYILPFYPLLIVEFLKTIFTSASITLYVTFSIILHYSIVTSYFCSPVCNLAFLEAALWVSQSPGHNMFSSCSRILQNVFLNYSVSDYFSQMSVEVIISYKKRLS